MITQVGILVRVDTQVCGIDVDGHSLMSIRTSISACILNRSARGAQAYTIRSGAWSRGCRCVRWQSTYCEKCDLGSKHSYTPHRKNTRDARARANSFVLLWDAPHCWTPNHSFPGPSIGWRGAARDGGVTQSGFGVDCAFLCQWDGDKGMRTRTRISRMFLRWGEGV